MTEFSESAGGENAFIKYIVTPILFGLAIATPLALFLSRGSPPEKEFVDPRPSVTTTRVEPAPSSFEIVTHGTVVPKKEITLAAEVAGRVIRTDADLQAGHFVKAGTALAEIEPTRYELAVKQLHSEIKQAEVDLLQLELEKENNNRLLNIAEEDLAISQREFDRVEELFQSSSASASQRDQASSTLMRSRNALQQIANEQRLVAQRRDRLEAQLELLKTRLKAAEWDLDKTKIIAPIDGFITEDLVEAGTYVQPGTALCRIEDRQSVEVKCNLKLDDLYWLVGSTGNGTDKPELIDSALYQAPRVPAIVSYEVAGRRYEWEDCFLARYEGTGLDEKTRTIPCRVEVPAPDRKRAAGEFPALVRGMFVEVRLVATPRKPLLQIPYAALRPNQEVWAVRGAEPDARLHLVKVRVARMLEDNVLLYAEDVDLEPGAAIVTSPLSVAVDRMKVRRVDALKPAAVATMPRAPDENTPREDQTKDSTGHSGG